MGRCAGCGYRNSSKKVKLHVMMCPKYIQLYQEHPERCLDPEAEQMRYKAEDATSEVRAAARHARLQQRFAEMDRVHATQATRWVKPKDILDD